MVNLFSRIKIKRKTECWLWQGSRYGSGRRYGHISYKRKQWATHRLAWHLARGDIPDGLHVLHKCDVGHCINPAHLFLGTHQDNMTDKRLKDRGVGDLSADEVLAIRATAPTMSKSALARHFKTHRKTVQRILNGTGYRHVSPI
jgi:hypothetical protein